MQFVNPYFLFASIAIAIPIIIHLFNFRKYKLVYFSNVSLLKDLQQETKKTSQVKHLLILLMRILTVLALVIAFAQPFIPLDISKKIINKSSNVVSVYIDNSFSMEASAEESTLLELAKTKAREIVSAYRPGDQFQLLTNDFEGKHQLLLSKEEFLDELEKVNSTASVKKISDVVKRQKDILETSNITSRSIFLITDMQKNMMDIDLIKQDSSYSVFLIPLKRLEFVNISIDSCWLSNPIVMLDKPVTLNVFITNSSSKEYNNMPVKLMVNGVQKAITPVTLKPDEKKQIQLSFSIHEAGIQSCVVQLDDYPVTFDDTYYFSLDVVQKIQVLDICEINTNPFIQKLFSNDSSINFTIQQIRSVNSSQLQSSNLVILDGLKTLSAGFMQELTGFIKKGGSVVLIPSSNKIDVSYVNYLLSYGIQINPIQDTTSTRIDFIDIKSPLYKSVFEKLSNKIQWPSVYAYYQTQLTPSSPAQQLIKMQNGLPFLLACNDVKGTLYIFTTSFNEQSTDFVSHSLIVPTLYQMMVLSQQVKSLFYTIWVNENIHLTNLLLADDEVCQLKLLGTQWSCIPEITNIENALEMNVHDQIKQAGNYVITQSDQPVLGISFNYDRRESTSQVYTNEEFSDLQKQKDNSTIQLVDAGKQSLQQYMLELNQGIKLWKYFLLAALLFLLTEILLIRFLK